MSTDPGRELESESSALPDLQAIEPEQFEAIHADVLKRLVWVMRTKHPHVVAANRRFEEETGIENKYGTNNLADALSHIGTLIEEAPSLDRDQQRAQITLLEDHFRRSMMESWEQLIDYRLGEIDELWETRYKGRLRRLQMAHKLPPGTPSAHEIDKLRIKIRNKLHEGREAKRAGDWDGWERGADLLIEACEAASELRVAIDDTIAASNSRGRSFGLVLLGVGISGVIALGIAAFNHFDRDDPSPHPPQNQQPRQR